MWLICQHYLRSYKYTVLCPQISLYWVNFRNNLFCLLSWAWQNHLCTTIGNLNKVAQSLNITYFSVENNKWRWHFYFHVWHTLYQFLRVTFFAFIVQWYRPFLCHCRHWKSGLFSFELELDSCFGKKRVSVLYKDKMYV